MSFQISFFTVLTTLFYILIGFLLCKSKVVKAEHLSSMSSILVYACSPFMIINAFLNLEFSKKNLANMGLFFLITLTLLIIFMGIIFLIFRKKFDDNKYRLLTIGSTMGNVGFFGMPIIQALFPENPEVLCFSSVYMVSMNILIFTIGVYCLTLDKKFITFKKALINPATIGILIALPIYIFGVNKYLPDMVVNSIGILGKMTTPLCMIILGIRLSTIPFKSLFKKPIVYFICLGKLIIFPLFCYLCVYFLPLDYSFKASILILSATPTAVYLVNMAEIHHSEEELSANCVLLSTLFCILTIPILSLLL